MAKKKVKQINQNKESGGKQPYQQNRVYDIDGVSPALCANKSDLLVFDRKIIKEGSLYNQATRWGVFNENGISPTITASMGMGGGHIPMVIDAKGVSMTGDFTNRKLSKSDKAFCLAANPSSDMKPMVEVFAVRGRKSEKDEKYEQKKEFRGDEKTNTLTSVQKDNLLQYGPRIRKLTPIECERLQTVPDNYTNHVSESQRYKMLGNGWTVDIVSHIFSYLKTDNK